MHRRDLPWHQKDANADVLQARPLCSPSAPSPSISKDTKPFVHNAIFLFRTRSVNKILSLLTSVVLPCLFFPPLSFPSCLYLPGDISCVPSLLSSGIFLLQGIMASTFFSLLLSSFSSWSWLLSVLYSTSLTCHVLVAISFALFSFYLNFKPTNLFVAFSFFCFCVVLKFYCEIGLFVIFQTRT